MQNYSIFIHKVESGGSFHHDMTSWNSCSRGWEWMRAGSIKKTQPKAGKRSFPNGVSPAFKCMLSLMTKMLETGVNWKQMFLALRWFVVVSSSLSLSKISGAKSVVRWSCVSCKRLIHYGRLLEVLLLPNFDRDTVLSHRGGCSVLQPKSDPIFGHQQW